MRAAHHVRVLSEIFEVHLLIIAMYGGHDEIPSAEMLACCSSWKRIDASLLSEPSSSWSFKNWISWRTGRLPREWSGWKLEHKKAVAEYLEETRCCGIWMFRFYLLPWIQTWLDEGGIAWMDLDELESKTRESQAKILLKPEVREEARRMQREVKIYRKLEKTFLSRFKRIITAAPVETERLCNDVGIQSGETWPNIVSTSAAKDFASNEERIEWRLLFIGSLGHFPNREGVRFAAEEILPCLQKQMELPVVLLVAGAGAAANRAAFIEFNQIRWLGTVPDVTPVYAKADIVIVPLRAGGGSRIKILEAFAHGKPVISTRIGAEGLNVVHERELILADSAEEIAKSCASLLIDSQKQKLLVTTAHHYVTSQHSEQILRQKAAALVDDLIPGLPRNKTKNH